MNFLTKRLKCAFKITHLKSYSFVSLNVCGWGCVFVLFCCILAIHSDGFQALRRHAGFWNDFILTWKRKSIFVGTSTLLSGSNRSAPCDLCLKKHCSFIQDIRFIFAQTSEGEGFVCFHINLLILFQAKLSFADWPLDDVTHTNAKWHNFLSFKRAAVITAEADGEMWPLSLSLCPVEFVQSFQCH